MNDLLFDLLVTAHSADLPVLSHDHCCQLMALLHMYGNCECFVFNEALKTSVQYAAIRLKLKGGCRPAAETVTAIQSYIRDIDSGGKPEWVGYFEVRYNVSFPEWVSGGYWEVK